MHVQLWPQNLSLLSAQVTWSLPAPCSQPLAFGNRDHPVPAQHPAEMFPGCEEEMGEGMTPETS